jgi:hypothetical protein
MDGRFFAVRVRQTHEIFRAADFCTSRPVRLHCLRSRVTQVRNPIHCAPSR